MAKAKFESPRRLNYRLALLAYGGGAPRQDGAQNGSSISVFGSFGRIRHCCTRRGDHDNQISGEQPNRASPRHISEADLEIVIRQGFTPRYARA
jgi:hypothetical protein